MKNSSIVAVFTLVILFSGVFSAQQSTYTLWWPLAPGETVPSCPGFPVSGYAGLDEYDQQTMQPIEVNYAIGPIRDYGGNLGEVFYQPTEINSVNVTVGMGSMNSITHNITYFNLTHQENQVSLAQTACWYLLPGFPCFNQTQPFPSMLPGETIMVNTANQSNCVFVTYCGAIRGQTPLRSSRVWLKAVYQQCQSNFRGQTVTLPSMAFVKPIDSAKSVPAVSKSQAQITEKKPLASKVSAPIKTIGSKVPAAAIVSSVPSTQRQAPPAVEKPGKTV